MINDRIRFMKDAALAAGQFMKHSDERTHQDKTNQKDFVTIADIKSQDLLRSNLRQHYPDTLIVSEEDDDSERQALFTPDFTGFVLDPIDGTYNFKRDMKESAISIGYIEKGEPVAGVIYDPYRDELYEAAKGAGALLNGNPIRVNDQTSIEGASVATSNSYNDEAMIRNLQRHLLIYDKTGCMPWTSCPGGGVLIMAWVASGRIDAYHHNGLKPWDNAASFLLVREAGGQVHTLNRERAMFTSNTILMGGPAIVSALESIFKQGPPELLQ